MEDKKSVIGTLRQKAKLLRSSRVSGDKNLNKPDVREERLLDQRMKTDVPQKIRTSPLSHSFRLKSSALSQSRKQSANLGAFSACYSSPTTPPNMRAQRRGAVTGIADSLNMLVDSTSWPSQDSLSDSPHEEQDFYEATEEMEQVLKTEDTQDPSTETVTEVMLIFSYYSDFFLWLCYTN